MSADVEIESVDVTGVHRNEKPLLPNPYFALEWKGYDEDGGADVSIHMDLSKLSEEEMTVFCMFLQQVADLLDE